MHAISFGLKRAHLSAVGFGKHMLAKVERMTPARFDLMYVLRRRALIEGNSRDPLAPSRSQSGLWKRLGLHRTTVSRMVRQLVEMGWVYRVRSDFDRRTFDVGLTPLGLRTIWKAMRRVFRPRSVRKAYEEIFRAAAPKQPVVSTIREVIRKMKWVAWSFGDRSNVWYDFGGGVPVEELWAETHLVPPSAW